MSYEIQDKLSLKILLNDEEFLFSRANSLGFLHMVQSTKVGVPMLHMALQDNVDFLAESKHLADGARIQIILAARSGKSRTFVFRLNSYRRTPSSGGYQYELDGYLDTSTYWHASTKDPIRGTSYSAIGKIAKACGLKFVGDQTADSQVWLPCNTRYHEWARLISERGFRSDSSCMQLGLNFDKTLVYKDLSFVRPRVKILKFGSYQKDTILVTDAVPRAAPGSMNHFSGYSEALVEQDLLATDPNRTHSKINVSKGERETSLLVNTKVKGAVEQSRVVFAPIDCGNSHPEYEKALYQNRRLNNLYSSRLDVVTPDDTDLKLLDRVSIALDKTTTYLQAYSGDYFVSARAIYIRSNEYFEKIELLRKAVNTGLQDAA